MITYKNLGNNGRFGNQLFQYAALCGIAKTNGYEYGVPYSNKSPIEIYNFCLPECFDNLEAKDSSLIYNFSFEIAETNFNYSPDLVNIPDNTNYTHGYFQTEKYFKHCKENLKKQFEFNTTITQLGNTYLQLFKDYKLISMHLRLGDYASSNGKHPVCPIEYYKSALELLPDDAIIFIFSDEINKAKEIFNSINKKIIYPTTNNKFIDMYLMTKCNYHIIANSSFSWWGAWLANSEKVIAPSKWFGDMACMPQNWSDIYCEDWSIL